MSYTFLASAVSSSILNPSSPGGDTLTVKVTLFNAPLESIIIAIMIISSSIIIFVEFVELDDWFSAELFFCEGDMLRYGSAVGNMVDSVDVWFENWVRMLRLIVLAVYTSVSNSTLL